MKIPAALGLLVTLTAAGESARYPVDSVWSAFVSFCSNESVPSQPWNEFTPEPGTSLAYLAENQTWRVTGMRGDMATVYGADIAGRTLRGFKRIVGSQESPVQYCQVYDFDTREKLVAADWARVAGPFSTQDELEHTQRFIFDARNNAPQIDGAIDLHLPGYFPPLDSVGFTGLQLLTFSTEPS